jgi:MFS transporter, DHA2 family, multidrug resistance protein
MADNLKATRREWIGLAVIALPCLLYAMDLTVLYLAVPHLTADLTPSSAQLLWIVDIYGFLVAGFLITMGTLGDRIGRRRLLLIGAAAFGAASVLAAFSTSAAMLIAMRALLGITAATLAPSTLSLIRNMFRDPAERTVAIGIWGMSFSVGGAVGPLLGGVLLEYFWWGSVFLINVPVMLLLLAVGPKLLPEYRDPKAGRQDLLSTALSIVAVLAVIYGLKRIAQDGVDMLPMASILAGLIVGYVFVRRQQRLADPLIDLRLFHTPAFSTSLAAYTFAIFIALGMFLFTAQYLQLVLGLSPLQAGLWMLPGSLGFVVGSMATPILVRRLRPVPMMAGGLVLAAIGFGVIAQVEVAAGLTAIVIGSICMSLGICPVIILGTDLIVSSAPPERAGAAASISETGAEFGGALGIAVLGSIATAVYRNDVVIPAELSPEAAEAARSTLGGAMSVAERLPDHLAALLLGPARDAFTLSMQLAAVTCAVIAIATAIMVVVLLPRTPPTGNRAGAAAEHAP